MSPNGSGIRREWENVRVAKSFFCHFPFSLNIHPLNPLHCFVPFLPSCFTLGIVFQKVFRVALSKRDCRDIEGLPPFFGGFFRGSADGVLGWFPVMYSALHKTSRCLLPGTEVAVLRAVRLIVAIELFVLFLPPQATRPTALLLRSRHRCMDRSLNIYQPIPDILCNRREMAAI